MTTANNPHYGNKVPHLMCEHGDISEIVLLPGDPGRVAIIGEYLENFKIISSNREYTVGSGFYKNVKITICSTGIGAPSAEIAIVELIEIGAKCLIRVGGTGVLRKEINCGDMVINTASMRRGGSSNFYAPAEYPAVASYQVVNALINSCKKNKVNYATGIGVSIGSFFAGQGRPTLGKYFNNFDVCEYYKNLNIINMEMEAETIMTLGSIYDVMTGCICAVHANRETDKWLIDFEPAQRKMIQIALDACVEINQELKNA